MALRAVGEVQDPTAKAQAQVRLADALAQADNRSDARRELAAALRTAEGIQNLEVRANTLVELAFVQKKRLADATVAGQTFDSVAGLVEKLDQPEARAAVWLRLAQAHTDLSSPEEALRAVESASQAARAIADPIQSAKAILPLAALQSRLGQAEAAGATLDAALEVARQGTNPYSRAFTTADVAAAMLAAQRVPRAREVLQEARQAAEQVPQEDTRREALKKVDAVAQTLPAA
jgi:tetratricopeptide (TPR) repeat protein